MIELCGFIDESHYIVENRFLRQAFENSAAMLDVAVHHAPFAETLQSKENVNRGKCDCLITTETCSSSIDELSNCHNA